MHEPPDGQWYAGREARVALLEQDEIDSLVSALWVMGTKYVRTRPDHKVEVSFIARSGMEIGCFWDRIEWMGFIRLEGFDPEHRMTFHPGDFIYVMKVLEQAKRL
jgi:hypothetical protein